MPNHDCNTVKLSWIELIDFDLSVVCGVVGIVVCFSAARVERRQSMHTHKKKSMYEFIYQSLIRCLILTKSMRKSAFYFVRKEDTLFVTRLKCKSSEDEIFFSSRDMTTMLPIVHSNGVDY